MSSKRRVIAINTREHRIYETEVSELSDMQHLVGGYIERACILKNGDEVYVNDEGLFEDGAPLFMVDGAHQPFAGNAYVIGPVDAEGDNDSVKSTVEEVVGLTRFLSTPDVRCCESGCIDCEGPSLEDFK